MYRNDVLVRALTGAGELHQAMDLVWQVFLDFEAPEYSDEGIREFHRFIQLEEVAPKVAAGEYRVWGAYLFGELAGVVSVRGAGHISLLFVAARFHRQGVAHALFEEVLNHCRRNGAAGEMTVHSSPYALEVYRRFGFESTGPEQVENGLRFIPMHRPL